MKLRILSYNIHKGFNLSNQEFTLERIKIALKELDPDIIFLQEVLGEHSKHTIPQWQTAIQFEYLADAVWQHFAYGKNAVYPEGHHGNAILSKYPIIDWQNLNISTNRFEQRGLLQARIQDPISGQELLLVNTHLNLTQYGRNQQIKTIAQHLKPLDKTPMVLVGDFNDWNKKASHYLEKELGMKECFKTLHNKYPRTFPAFFPLLSLDRVLVKGLTVQSAEVLKGAKWRKLSDHLPLVVEIELRSF